MSRSIEVPCAVGEVRAGADAFGVVGDVPTGWEGLAAALFEGIAAAMACVPGCRLRIWRVRQHAGALRLGFAFGGAPVPVRERARIAGLTAVAEALSEGLCDVCGAHGSLREGRDGVSARCDAHAVPGSRPLPGRAGACHEANGSDTEEGVMGQEVFHVRADQVDGDFWIETSATRRATVQLHATLELARDPRRWLPLLSLTGAPGSGKSALARRVARQAARNVACRVATEAVARGGRPESADTFAEMTRRAESIARDLGHCPAICSPMLYRDARPVHVTDMRVAPRGGIWYSGILGENPRTPGDLRDDPLRRTTLVLIDHADHLLNASRSQRRLVIDTLMSWPDRRHTYVFIGGPELARALAEVGTTQLIEVAPLPDDGEFAAVVGMVFGTRDPVLVTDLHRRSGGLMGPLLSIAALEGLSPPYHVPPAEIRRLPPPAT